MKLYLVQNDNNEYSLIKSRKRPKQFIMIWPKSLPAADVKYATPYQDARGAWQIAIDDGAKSADAVGVQKVKAVTDAYNLMLRKIYSEMYSVFGTISDVSANADKQTLELMIAKPQIFDNEGLKAKADTVSIPKGTPLNTILTIQTYATEMLDRIDQFAIYRMREIKVFQDLKELVLNG